jgi:hypothetical protein
MKKITLLLLTALCLNHLWLFAQDDYLHCGSDQVLHTVLNSNPKLKEEYLKREAESMLRDKQAFATGYKLNGAKQMVPVYIIPIVFHIINQGGTENISDAQVKDAVRILNEDYRKLNANMANTVSRCMYQWNRPNYFSFNQ